MYNFEFNANIHISYNNIRDFIIHNKITELKDFADNLNIQKDLIDFVCIHVYKDNVSNTDSELIDQEEKNTASYELEVIATKIIAGLTNRTYEEVYEEYEKHCDS